MTPFIQQTDIFHPHGDPDDHWDLGTVYALASQGSLNLQGVLFDFPPVHRRGDPATLAMAQLGHLTGITGTPFAVGSRFPLRSRDDTLNDKDQRCLAAAQWLCRTLDNSPEQMVINIVGSCTDVALAGLLRPDLFASKCMAVYLNAGAAHPGKNGELEYNVKLNPGSYAAIFDLPCPVYWCPCWHQTQIREIGENGTWYSFLQDGVFAHMDDSLVNFFLYMLHRSPDPKYLRYLDQPVDPLLRSEFGQKHRSMWSTASIIHAAGMAIDTKQGLLPASQVSAPLFEFQPIAITCANDGHTTWKAAEGDSGRYIFRIHEPEQYAQAMTRALASLLGSIESSRESFHGTADRRP